MLHKVCIISQTICFNTIVQVMEKAKVKGEQDLRGRREKLMVELEKLGRRMEEFAECSELDMMQQVK